MHLLKFRIYNMGQGMWALEFNLTTPVVTCYDKARLCLCGTAGANNGPVADSN
jgi:hypothetical protein